MTMTKRAQADSPASRPESREMARHIASTAARLFAERGYDATSVREIVAAAGVTKPTLYYHFRSKEGLAQALLTDPLAALTETIRRIDQTAADPLEALERILDAQIQFFQEDPDRARFIFALLFGPVVAGLVDAPTSFRQSTNKCMAGLAERLAASGVVPAARAGAFILACRGVVIGYMLAYLYHGQEIEQGLAGRVVGDLLRGFARDAGSETGSRT